MDLVFSTEEARVLGSLMEKQMTTPEYYPMSPNALKNACNQKSNRYPVVEYDDEIIQSAIDSLRKKSMLTIVSGAGSRVRKYEHRMKEVFFLSQKEMATICILMLRGPQTVGEIRGRSERMAEFTDLADVEKTLNDLMAESRNPKALVKQLPVFPGQKEHRFVHLLCGEPEIEPRKAGAEAVANANAGMVQIGKSKITELEEKVEELSRELLELKEQFQQFKKQFE
jgi:hypothetical protein